jgi:uncharacterized protein (TIGR02246 family)
LMVMLTAALSCLAAAETSIGTPAQVADELYEAFRSSDPDRIKVLMADDVKIFESGRLEASLDEYASHHLAADMDFLQHLERKVTAQHVEESDALAVVTTLSLYSGIYKEVSKRLRMTETLVMKNTDEGWRIHAVHWSSK